MLDTHSSMMRVAWLPHPDAPDTLARELLDLADDLILHPCPTTTDVADMVRHGRVDVVLIPVDLDPTLLPEVVPQPTCVVAYGVRCTLERESEWIDAGATGVVEAGDADRLLRFLHRASRLHQRVHAQQYDPVTTLPRRRSLLERLACPPAEGARRGVLLFDLVSFAAVNDGFGTEVGDRLLASVAQRLRDHFAHTAWVARTGSDEFAAVIEPAPTDAVLREIGQAAAGKLGQPVQIDDVRITPRIRLGFAASRISTGADLLRDAANALCRIKAQEGQGIGRFDERTRASNMSRVQMGTDFDRALSGGEFALHYQPIIDFEDGGLLGFEALARWNHPQRGLISPNEFVPLAEHTGFIVELGRWVLHEACRQTQHWRTTVPGFQDVTINVNLSPRQLREPNLVHTVAEALEFSRLPAEALHLELTENRALHDVATEIARMHALRALGVQVHIDDFGSGFAQLGWLARLPVDVIKIDRSLVTGLQASQRKRDVVHGIVDLAKRLDIGLVAEGVETRAELDCLRAAGIRYGQGYLFSPPVPAPRASVFAGQDLRAMAV